jgi:hypothetical protein
MAIEGGDTGSLWTRNPLPTMILMSVPTTCHHGGTADLGFLAERSKLIRQ